jgi:hypothetical protein
MNEQSNKLTEHTYVEGEHNKRFKKGGSETGDKQGGENALQDELNKTN